MKAMLVTVEQLASGESMALKDSVVVVCSADGAEAARQAGLLTEARTAVFVGDLDDASDQRAASLMAAELFENLGPRPADRHK